MPTFTSERRPWAILIPLLALIIISSAVWLGNGGLPGVNHTQLLLATLAVCGATLINLALRWLRWHFLLRTLHIRIRTRESLLIFTSLLPMVLTPWASGEWLLALALRRRATNPLRAAILVWLTCRAADAIALALILFAGASSVLYVIAIALLWTVARPFMSFAPRDSDAARAPRLVNFLALSLAAWGCAGASLYIALLILQTDISIAPALLAFAKGTLTGSLSGLPAGIAITGTSIIHQLTAINIPEHVAIWSVAALRWGTVGFAVALGILVVAKGRRALRAIIQGTKPPTQGHFADLAPEYEKEIPAHVRNRLIKTKSAVILRTLQRCNVPTGARGLDIGCGQGWYLARIAKNGYTMAGCDLAAGQIAAAKKFCDVNRVSADLHVASADALPFADNTFDFAYAINVLHHITDRAAFDRALREIIRTLKPGAPFIVFEMNTLNPLFRFYLSYIFPFIRNIDDGTEVWLLPGSQQLVPGATWSREIDYITFLPDFLPGFLIKPLSHVESLLEHSPLRRFSAHFACALIKNPLP